MMHVQRITPIVKVELELPCEGQIYLILVMYT